MLRNNLPTLRDHLVQHECFVGARKVRVVDNNITSFRIAHPKSGKNPNVSSVPAISKEQYLKPHNNGGHAQIVLEKNCAENMSKKNGKHVKKRGVKSIYSERKRLEAKPKKALIMRLALKVKSLREKKRARTNTYSRRVILNHKRTNSNILVSKAQYTNKKKARKSAKSFKSPLRASFKSSIIADGQLLNRAQFPKRVSKIQPQAKLGSFENPISIASEGKVFRRLAPSWKVAGRIGKNNINAPADGEEILVYPKHKTGRGAVTLTMNDIRRLKPGVYINDNLLDFYLSYLYWEKWDEPLRKRVHVFNTFFFKKWIGCKQREGDGTSDFKLSRYTVVRKWTKNVDIFTKDFLVIPVNYHLHWSLAIVCNPQGILEKSMNSNSRCCILGFDSLTKFRNLHFAEIKRFLDMVRNDRGKKSVRILPFVNDRRCSFIPTDAPSQSNGADCGLFVMQNCEKFFDSIVISNSGTLTLGTNWYSSLDISQKRKQILDLISTKAGVNLSIFL